MEHSTLRYLGRLSCRKPTRFKKIIIPELAFSGGNYYTKEFENLIDIIVKNASRSVPFVPPKIYLSRTKFSNDKEHGEDKLERVFRTNGYQIVYPEKLSVKKQIVFFNQADELAMVAGSLSHNLMFTRSNHVKATILNKFKLVNSYQLTVDDMTKAQLTYVDSFLSIRHVLFGMGPFLLSPTRYFKQFLIDHSYKSNFSTRPSTSDLRWYFKKYHETYQSPDRKSLLKSQKAALKSAKRIDK